MHSLRKKLKSCFILLILSILCTNSISKGQQLSFLTSKYFNEKSKNLLQEKISATKNELIYVYLDRFWRYEKHTKREIPFVNYVRDVRQAQVYILYTSQRTGGGGSKITLTFIGQKNFQGVNDTLSYNTKQFETEEIKRAKLIKILKLGLMRYVARTPQYNNFSINYKLISGVQRKTLQEIKDKWNFWVFNISPDMNIESEESYKDISIRWRLSANRITENWKIQFYYTNRYNESRNVTPDKTYVTIKRRQFLSGLLVKSITNHWSIGAYTVAESSTWVNTHLSLSFAPAIEYNIFPYSQSTRRFLSFLYSIWAKNVKYNEVTLFNKISENLYGTSLRISQNIYEKWGNIWSSLEGSIYFHDANINRLNWEGGISYRLYEGLSFNIRGEISLIHDQLFLPKENKTTEEILLKVQQLKTNWKYELSFGFNYRFGSKFNNIVNPRFETRRR